MKLGDGMAIQINSKHALIGIDRNAGNFSINKIDAALNFHRKQPKVNIESEKPKVMIDQYEAYASAGLKNRSDLLKEYVDRGLSAASEYAAKYASDGDSLAMVEKGNPIPSFAERDRFPEKEFGMVSMPSAPIRISVTGSLKIQADTETKVESEYTPGKVNINITPDKVSIYLKQYASLSINYIPESNFSAQI